MPTLLMCPNGSDLPSLTRFHDVPEGSLLDRWGREPRSLSPRVPYLLGSDHGGDELDYCRMLEPHGGLLCDMCQDFGGAATVGLAEISADLRSYLSRGESVVGAAAGVYATRVARFAEAMERHQRAIEEHFRATHPGAPKTLSSRATREALLRSGAELSRMFRHELALVTKGWFPRSRMLVSGGAQVPDRVRHSPKISRLDVATRAVASKLVEWGHYARYLGRGLVVVDLGRRAQNVYEVQQSGGDWHRQAFVETGGFGAGLGTGVALTGVTMAALEIVVAATPVGWVLIVGSLAVAGIVAGGSIAMSSAGEQVFGDLYDKATQINMR